MRVCFVRYYAYPLFDPAAPGQFGGAEVRAVTFAQALAARGGYEVCFAVDSLTPRPPQRFDKIQVHFRSGRPHRQLQPSDAWTRLAVPVQAGYRFFRSMRKRLGYPPLEAQRFVEELGADLYCCFGANLASSEVIQAARLAGANSILFTILDTELADPARAAPSAGADRKLARARQRAFRDADEVVVQNIFQQERLRRHYGRTGVLIRNPIDLTPRPQGRPAVPHRFALWVGRAELTQKRPDRCLDLARRCPHIAFVMVMNQVDPATHEALCRLAPSNVQIVHQVPYPEIEAYFQSATVLVNTSTIEGFPNTFLQAAKYGIPILSLSVDPDGMLEGHGCGQTAAGEPHRMTLLLEQIWQGGPEVARISAAARRYVAAHHDLSQRTTDLERTIEQVLSRQRERAA